MTDLYKLLGLAKKASHAEIRSAYRKKVKRAHPDSPYGSQEKFEALKLAHDVLLNSERRAYYDSTGKIKPDDPDAGRGPVLAMVASALAFCVNAAVAQSINVKTEDLIEALCSVLSKKKAELDASLDGLKQRRAIYTELAGRFQGKDGDNTIDGIVKATLSAMEAEGRMHSATKANCEAALTLVKSHTFRRDLITPQRYQYVDLRGRGAGSIFGGFGGY